MSLTEFLHHNPADYWILVTMVGSILLFGSAAVLAMGWAFRHGQFENFQQGSQSIFGPDEPIGETTDEFPQSRENRVAQ